MIVALCVHTAAALDGSGTQQDPWRIESLADFDEFAADPNYWSGFTRLESDVNLAGRTYSTAVIAPDIDNSNYSFDGTAFTGVFDGNDHKLIGLTIDDGGTGNWYLGLFGYIDGGDVKNLHLEGGDASGYVFVGCLVGVNVLGSISNCYSTGDVSGSKYVGGLVGANGYWRSPGGPITNCHSTGDVSGDGGVGGLVGSNGDTLLNCYSTGDVNGTERGVGGLVGLNCDSVSSCYSTGDVSGYGSVGGLVGENGYYDGWVSLPGYIYNSYSTGAVEGALYVGGLVGYNFAGDIEGSFWDVQTSGEPNMCGLQTEYATGCDPNCGKTTAEMQTRSTFTEAGWDFIEIWGIGEHQTYPYLRFAPAGDLNYDKKVDLVDLAILASHWLEGKDN